MATTVCAEESPLYVPPDPKAARCFQFLDKINTEHGIALQSYADLYAWSTAHLDLFWGRVWDEVAIIGYKGSHIVDNDAVPQVNPPWFEEAKLNWAENMLHCRSEHKIALIQASQYFASL